MYCHNCKSMVSSQDEFCSKCGVKLPGLIVCPNCGATVNHNDTFCQKCGVNLKNTYFATKVNNKKFKIIFSIALLLLVCVGILILLINTIFSSSNDYTKALDTLFSSYNECNAEDYISVQEIKNYSKNEVPGVLRDAYSYRKEIFGDNPVISYKLNYAEVYRNNDYQVRKLAEYLDSEYSYIDSEDITQRAVVCADVNNKGSEKEKTSTEYFDLVCENGKWKIYQSFILSKESIKYLGYDFND